MTQITIDFSFEDFSFANDWLDFVYLSFEITNAQYEIDYKWISISGKEELINIPFTQAKFKIQLGGEILIQKLNNSLPRFCFSSIDELFYDKIIEHLMREYSSKIIFGKVVESIENVLQNVSTIDSWRRKKREMPCNLIIIPNPIYTNEREKEIISIESLPGHSHIMDYSDMLFFGSCWQMYFSPIYYKYIPKSLFDNFNNCFENLILNDQVRRITLHENIINFNLPENRDRQWAFRRELGIDSIAHELTRSSNRIEPQNLPVLITKDHCEVGTTRVTRFLDNNSNLVSSDIAVKKDIKEYLDNGITIVFEMIGSVN